MKYDEILDQSLKDLELSLDDIEGHSIRTPSIHHKYVKELMAAKDLYVQYEAKLKKIRKQKWLYYAGKARPEVYEKKPLDLKVMKSDLKMFIEADDEFIDMEYKLAFVKRKIELIERTLDECNRRSFHLSTAHKMLKFKNGEM